MDKLLQDRIALVTGGAQGVLVTAVHPSAFGQAIHMSRRGGTIVFNGLDITKTPSYRIGHLGMARTFQVVKPFRGLTVRENVATGAMFGARGKGRTAAEARSAADEVLELSLIHI